MIDLTKAVHKLLASNADAANYFKLAEDTYFEEVLNAYKLNNIDDIKRIFPLQFDLFYTCMLEYYCCNLYPHPDMEEYWNAIDVIKKSNKLSKKDKEFLDIIKSSYVSLYKVYLDEQSDKIMLKNIIEDEVLEVDKNQEMMTYVDRTIYARLLKTKDKLILGDGCFIFPEAIAHESANTLLQTQNMLMESYNKMPPAEFFKHTKLKNKEDITILLKNIWGKDLLNDYIYYLLEKPEEPKQQHTLH